MMNPEKTIELLKSLVEINSMNPSLSPDEDGEAELAEFLGSYLEELGLEITYQQLEGRRKNVIATLKGSGEGKSLILNAHTDTVGKEGMEEPCTPTFSDGKVYGRGSYDMKGGMASCILAIERIVSEGVELRGDVIFAGVADEEYWSIGTEELIKEFTADAAIICEPTNSRIVIAHKGFSWIKLITHGKAAHGSKPHLGIDAISKANKVMNEIETLQTEFNNNPHPLAGQPLIRVSKIEGGLGLSTIPDKCTLFIERRTLPSETRETISKELQEIIDRLKEEDDNFDAEFEIIIYRSGLEVAEDEPIVQVLSKHHQKITGDPIEFAGEPWWMDSALMADVGIPTVVLGPNGDGAHAAEEFVEVASVNEISEILYQTVCEFCE